jgi:hypothetical protein
MNEEVWSEEVRTGEKPTEEVPAATSFALLQVIVSRCILYCTSTLVIVAHGSHPAKYSFILHSLLEDYALLCVPHP